MKKGMDLQALAAEIQRVEESKRDFVAPTTKLWMQELPYGLTGISSNNLELEVEGNGQFGVNNVAHEQIADKLQIPRRYYEKMRVDAPELLATNVNAWFRKNPTKNLVRTLDGNVRAFLSDRYRPIDNFLVTSAAFPVFKEQKDEGNLIEVLSCEMTEKRLYIQIVTPKIQAEVKKGDIVQAGIILSNSEVGCGAIKVEPLLYRLACLNGMIRSHSLRRHHVGRRVSSDENVIDMDFYQAETVEADSKAFMLKIRDTVRNAFDQITFDDEIKLLQATAENKIETGKIDDTVKEITARFGFSNGEKDSILSNLIEGADLSQYGLANAVTALANSTEEYDRVVELERFGGQIVDLSASEWKAVAG